jgi:elongator complex protein 4
MAFRKRNIGIGRQPASPASPTAPEAPTSIDQLPGVRPSPLTSHPVTSTGAPSIDGLLGGHSGLALGSSLLIGEHDTTDFAGALLRYYAAEGILQGHVVHVVGVGEGWTRELPGLADARYLRKQEQEKVADTDKAAQDRMKIAWRYERLGQAGERGACVYCVWVASDSSRYPNTLLPAIYDLFPFLLFQLSIQLTGK